jgi:hypothetical protein
VGSSAGISVVSSVSGVCSDCENGSNSCANTIPGLLTVAATKKKIIRHIDAKSIDIFIIIGYNALYIGFMLIFA